MKVVAFELSDSALRARYDELFDACPHAFLQQSTAWAEAISDLSPDRAIFLLAMEGPSPVGGLPLYLFSGEPGPVLTSVPHAGPLGGVFCRRDADRDAVHHALLTRADALAAEHECLALSLITNPLDDDLSLYQRHLQPQLTLHNFTQVVPLEVAVRDGVFVLRNNKKNNPAATLRKAEIAGFRTRICTQSEEFDRWYEIHAKRASEIGTSSIRRTLAERIWRDLGRRGQSFLLLVMAGEEIAAGCLFILHRDVCDVFAVSMDSRFAADAPNYLAIREAMLEMARRGVKVMNWQSSPRRRDGVYKFKRQWGSVERPYAFVTRTYGPDDTLLRLGPEGVRHAYPDHFVVPFGAFASGRLSGEFEKGA
jgi:hypothetical protein